ncbi:uncharacterized protein LOC118203120 [Stegodyphus dumicola]|uniref:uncharacterized protein LOC118203120 n=1 Tax=Stegodyphus dumicola TaxID=202533 RepID=UPI0015B2A11E|nr:uncharacterized protein LOC118203120 [Stegodyphus dumicola]
MPQEFQVLCCFNCEMFQVHQVKKSKTWSCKICNEKQSLKKVFGIGSARDCRSLVQQFNLSKGEKKSCQQVQNESYFTEDFKEEDLMHALDESDYCTDDYDFSSELFSQAEPIMNPYVKSRTSISPLHLRYEASASNDDECDRDSFKEKEILNVEVTTGNKRKYKSSECLHDHGKCEGVKDKFYQNSIQELEKNAVLVSCIVTDKSIVDDRQKSLRKKNRGFQLIVEAAAKLN